MPANTSIAIREGTKSISWRGFFRLQRLEGNPQSPSVGSSAFIGVRVATCKIYVPKGAIAAYQKNIKPLHIQVRNG